MKCKELQVGDKVALINGIITTIIEAGEGYAYATLNGYETMDPWEFNDQDNHPEGIPLTKEMLDANGFRYEEENDYSGMCFYSKIENYESPSFMYYILLRWEESSEGRKPINIYCLVWENGKNSSVTIKKEFYVHTLQHALRLIGLSEIADNFKV